MNDQSNCVGPSDRMAQYQHDQYVARRREAEAARRWAIVRQAELVAIRGQTQRRQEELRLERARLRAQLALRRSAFNTADRRAAAAILEAAVVVSGMDRHELWLEYFALGGDSSLRQVEEMLSGDATLTRIDHDRLAVVLNERLAQNGCGRPLAYWDGSR